MRRTLKTRLTRLEKRSAAPRMEVREGRAVLVAWTQKVREDIERDGERR